MTGLRRALALILIVDSVSPALRAWAGEDRYFIDAKSGRQMRQQAAENNARRPDSKAEAKPEIKSKDVKAALDRVRNDPRLAADQKAAFEQVVTRYEQSVGAETETREALDKLTKELSDPKKDPGLALARVFDSLAESARRSDTRAISFSQMHSPNPAVEVLAVNNTATGRTIFVQESRKLNAGESIRTIRKPIPDKPGQEQVDAIILEVQKGAIKEQRVIYNRHVHDLFMKLKRGYYDQCGLVRRINNGEKPLAVSDSGCAEPEGVKDEQLTAEAREKLKKLYAANRAKFERKAGPVLEYLGMLDRLKAAGKLGELPPEEWKKLERIQRLALQFYNENQLETYQRVVIMQLTNYFSTVTNVSPKAKKGDDQVDITAKDLKDFQKALDDFRKGDMEGYTGFLRKLGYYKLDENDKAYISEDLMALASEAFANVAYAAKAQARLLEPGARLSGQEKDALIEEASNWLRLAQIQVQAFDLQTQAIQLSRLAEGKVRGIGIDHRDERMIAQAQKLAATARDQYMPELMKANGEAKRTLLRQTLAQFHATYRGAVDSYIFDDTLKERLKVLAAKASQMLDLYLSNAFEKVRMSDKYRAEFSALDKAKGGAYQHFLKRLPPEVAALKRDLEKFREELEGLGQLQSIQAIRQGLMPLEGEFKRLAKAIEGSDEPPTLIEMQKEAQRQSVAHGKVFAAAQTFSNNMRLFDMLNELEVYVTKYASSDATWSRADNFWTKLASMKWLDQAYSGITFGARDKAIDKLMQNPLTKEAFEKLKGNPALRAEMLEALRKGDFAKVYEIAQKLDKKAADRAILEAKLEKIEDDPTDLLDFDGLLNRQNDNDALTGALGGTAKRFGYLNKLIMGYSAASAVTDAVITVAATAVGGPFISFGMKYAGQGLLGVSKWAAGKNAVNGIETAGRISKLINAGRNAFLMPVEVVFNYGGKVIDNAARNVRKATGLVQHEGKGVRGAAIGLRAAAGQTILADTWINAIQSTIGSMMMMSAVSAGMSAALYRPEQGQFENIGEAALQGAVQGLSFGAKAGPIIQFSPVPAAAFSGRTGAVMNTIANMPGPITGLIQGVYRAVPSLARSQAGRAMAEGGALGALANAGVAGSAGYNALVRFATFGGGFIDGALKFWVPTEGVMIGVQVGSAISSRFFSDDPVDKNLGATSYVARIADAQTASMTYSQLVWVLLPTNPAFSPREMKDQAAQMKAFNAVVNAGPEKLRELAVSPNGRNIDVVMPAVHRSLTEHVLHLISKTGLIEKPKSTFTLTVNEQWTQMAWKALMRGEPGKRPGYTTAEIIAAAHAPLEGNGRIVDRGMLVRGLSEPEALQKALKPGGGPELKPGEIPARKPAGEEAMEVRRLEIMDPKTKVWGEATPATARWTVPAPDKPGFVEVLDSRTGTWVKNGTEGAPVAREIMSGKPNEDRITGHYIQAAKYELERRLHDGESGLRLREQILLSKGNTLTLEGVEIKGKPLEDLRKTVALSHLETLPTTANPLVSAADVGKRTSDLWLDRKLESTAQRLGRALRDDTLAHSEAIGRSREKRAAAVVKQAEEMIPKTRHAPDADVLRKVVTLLKSGKIDDAMGELKKASDGKLGPDGKPKADALGIPSSTLLTMRRSLEEKGMTADLIAIAARESVEARFGKLEGVDKAAVDLLRQALEGDAARQAVVRKGLDAEASRDPKRIAEATGLYVDVWERGVFGQMAGEVVPVYVKGKDGKPVVGADGKPQVEMIDGPGGTKIMKTELAIPEERSFRNRFGAPIPGFRPLQKHVITEALSNVAMGDYLNFGQMPTSGGKTLTNFTLIEYLDTHAKKNGREGVIYLTTNPDLVAQATADYIAFFGKKPAFEIMTYGDISARIAQSLEQGMPSPLTRFYLVADEGDKPASEVPTSVGMFNGAMSKARLDPVQIAMQNAANRFVDHEQGFYKTHVKEGEGRVTEQKFHERMANDPKFQKDFKELVRQTVREMSDAERVMKSARFRDNLDLTEYPEYLALYNGDAKRARAELQRTMVEEYRHAKRTAELLHGSLEKRMERFFQGGYQFASEPERSTKLTPDKDPNRGVINYNNGIAYDNLSTPEGPFGAAYYRRPITNEFESAGVLNYRGLIEEAKKTNTVFFATSGTAAAKIRRIFMEDFNFKFIGEISVADPFKTRTLAPASDWMLAKETIDFINSGTKGNNISFKFAHTLEEGDALFKTFSDHFGSKHVSVLVRPGSALEELERYSEEVKHEKNLPAFERGDAKVVIIVGWAGLRGLEANLKKYDGREARMDILDPQKLPTEELTQLIGRLASGRAGMLSKRHFQAIIRPESLQSSETLPQAVQEVARRLESAQAKGDLVAAQKILSTGEMREALGKAVKAGKWPADAEITPAQIIEAVRLRDAENAAWDGKRVKDPAHPNNLWDHVLLETIKDPRKLETAELVTEISEILKLRASFKPAEIEALLKPGRGEAAETLRRGLLEDASMRERTGLMEVMTAAMGRREQDIAISSSGILDRPGQSGPGLIDRLRGAYQERQRRKQIDELMKKLNERRQSEPASAAAPAAAAAP